MKTLVIPDIHGDAQLLQDILDKEWNVDEIVQLGDLANCVIESRDGDIECLRLAQEYDIKVLVGNHEYPYLGGKPFSGFFHYPEVKEEIKKLHWRVATTVGDEILVTHAGLHPRYNYYKSDNPFRLAQWLNLCWNKNPMFQFFADVGQIRGGRYPQGGILWRDFHEKSDKTVKQVFGHTPNTCEKDSFGNLCIDCKKPFIF